jgi:hypothetical protein
VGKAVNILKRQYSFGNVFNKRQGNKVSIDVMKCRVVPLAMTDFAILGVASKADTVVGTSAFGQFGCRIGGADRIAFIDETELLG